jgi:hypothetical protein
MAHLKFDTNRYFTVIYDFGMNLAAMINKLKKTTFY